MIIVADKKGRTDGTMSNVLSLVKTDIPIVLMARTGMFKFNDELTKLDKYVLVEASEMGWDWKFTDSHVWGKNTELFPQFQDQEYQRFDEWVAGNPPLFTFTRELLKKDVSENHLPIDYPCWYEAKEIQTKEQFSGRPIDAFYFWGRSHEARLRLHSGIWMAASEKGFSVCDNLTFFEKFVMEEEGRKWVTLNIPHYGRIDIRELLGRQALSKTSVAMPGAGIKTFRHCESSINSVMVKWVDDMAWSFTWNETNCILTEGGKEIENIQKAINNPDLYEIYKEGIANCQKYQINNYINNYILPKINEFA